MARLLIYAQREPRARTLHFADVDGAEACVNIDGRSAGADAPIDGGAAAHVGDRDGEVAGDVAEASARFEVSVHSGS